MYRHKQKLISAIQEHTMQWLHLAKYVISEYCKSYIINSYSKETAR